MLDLGDLAGDEAGVGRVLPHGGRADRGARAAYEARAAASAPATQAVIAETAAERDSTAA